MACGKGNANQPIEDFIVHSPAPVDMAAKMSAIYNELSFKVKKNIYDIYLMPEKKKYVAKMPLNVLVTKNNISREYRFSL